MRKINVVKKEVTLLLVLGLLFGASGIQVTNASKDRSVIHHVYPGPGTPIQNAVDNASDGDTVLVHTGRYYETIIIDKTIILQGTGDFREVILDGSRHPSDAVGITLLGWTGTKVRYFTIQNFGIGINNIDRCDTIERNLFKDNGVGFYSESGGGDQITGNIFWGNGYGIYLDGFCFSYYIHDNDFVDNGRDVWDLTYEDPYWYTVYYLYNFYHDYADWINGDPVDENQDGYWDEPFPIFPGYLDYGLRIYDYFPSINPNLQYTIWIIVYSNYQGGIAEGGTTCFLGETRVTMSDGSTKNIEDIEIGDLVSAYDGKNHQVVPAKVIEVYHHAPSDMGRYYLVINDDIRVTPNHPLYINKQWKEAGDAQIGDYLFDLKGRGVRINSITIIPERVPTYNLEIETYHTYFANGILAHNVKHEVLNDWSGS